MRSTLTIRSKLAAALAVPLLALATLAGLQLRGAIEVSRESAQQADLATSSIGPGGIITALQNERNFQSLRAIGAEGLVDLAVSTADEANAATDRAITGFRSTLDSLDASAADAYTPALGSLERDLTSLRTDADDLATVASLANAEQASALFGDYTEVIGRLLDANARVALGIDDAQLRSGVELLDALSRQNDVEARLVREGAAAGVLQDPRAALEARRLTGLQATGEAMLRTRAVGPYAEPVLAVLDHPERAPYVAALQAVADDPFATELEAILGSVPDGADAQLRGAQAGVARVVTERARALRDDAAATVRNYLVAAVGVVALAVLVMALANLWITKPLRRLADEAEVMATETLPRAVHGILATPLGDDVALPEIEPVRVRGGAEVRGVVDALDAVQHSAVHLAVEQAVLRRNIADSFLNLGRRNQNLLARQIDLISSLEADEQDPDALERLFALDHLATRMRRNAESLLVLAGDDAPRQWSSPVEIGDVVRAALGEVEQYPRVSLGRLEDATVAGRAVTDVSHVVAELLENALSFSAPDTAVEVYGRATTGGYLLTVSDHGIGMDAETMRRANERLSSAEPSTVAPSRYLGLYVVAELASRHGIDVALSESPGGGVTATVLLPPTTLEAPVGTPAAPSSATVAPGPVGEPVVVASPGPELPEQTPVFGPPLAPVVDTEEPGVPAVHAAPAADSAAADESEPEFELAPVAPYAELMDLAPEAEAGPVAPTPVVGEEPAGSFFGPAPLDDLLPRREPRRSRHVTMPAPRPAAAPRSPATRPADAPAVPVASVAVAPNGGTTVPDGETPAHFAPPAPASPGAPGLPRRRPAAQSEPPPVPSEPRPEPEASPPIDDPRANVAFFAAFRAAAAQGRVDGARTAAERSSS